ncbi:FAD-dependent oxidoreductase [Planobispora rosea]|uniref:FAD-dependent oxidoreductase n=1 Tax=Planobispora rosea TaxID=35762 RepID=A0A8J3S6T1_PLARO|nr:FAD-dependent monooxygenase [Planobispora rosea]GGS91495.1 FAD-dependent oxidoreductase [Planobispora rosea]GIH87021.1 FAD-dependent oxidoreductase [Planobispora rosea]
MSKQARRRALVVGLGIAGIATAVRLHQIGWSPVLLERAPARRSSGYFIALFGAGTASARRLGVLEAIGDRTHRDFVAYEVNRAGRRRPGVGFADLPGRPRTLLRGDVERGLFSALPDDVEIRYSTVPTRFVQDDQGVDVTLLNTATATTTADRFDLVVGADGMRSTVRELVFGSHSEYLHPLNYMIGATTLDEPVDGFSPNEGLVLAEPGRSVWTFPFDDRPPGLLFSYRTDDVDREFSRPPSESVRAAFGPEPAGALLEHLLAKYEGATEVLFDSVNQVKMPRWHRGRIVLVGDAAWCLSLYSGMGASSGIAGGELLGTMLDRHPGNMAEALRKWEARMRPFVLQEQKGALELRTLFTPHDRKEHLHRSIWLRLIHTPMIGSLMGRIIEDGGEMANKNFDIAAA